MFKLIEILEQVYGGGAPSKITARSYSNNASHGRKRNGGEAASPTNPKKGRADKRKKIMQSVWAISRPVTKYDLCMAPDTPPRSLKYSRNTQKSVSRSRPTNKPALVATKSVVSP